MNFGHMNIIAFTAYHTELYDEIYDSDRAEAIWAKLTALKTRRGRIKFIQKHFVNDTIIGFTIQQAWTEHGKL